MYSLTYQHQNQIQFELQDLPIQGKLPEYFSFFCDDQSNPQLNPDILFPKDHISVRKNKNKRIKKGIKRLSVKNMLKKAEDSDHSTSIAPQDACINDLNQKKEEFMMGFSVIYSCKIEEISFANPFRQL